MKQQKTLRLIIILIFGLALLAGIGYLIMQKVEQWYIMSAKAEVAGEVAEQAKGFIGGFMGDR